MVSLKRNSLYSLFFVTLLTTEFFHISIGAGVARIYHFAAPLVILALVGYVPRLFGSAPFLALGLFWLINVAAAVLSDSPSQALASMSAVTANMALSVATALVLVSGRLRPASLVQLLVKLTVVCVLWGILQLVAHQVAGVTLGLSSDQDQQIAIGLTPSFRTEANTFGKFLMVPFLLFIPEFVRRGRSPKWTMFYLVLVLGFFAAFTRTSIYGTALALLFVLVWYVIRGRASGVFRKFGVIGAFGTIVLAVFASGSLNVSEYALHKIDTIFSRQEALEGASSAFRILSMQNTFEAFTASDKTVVIGNGWGQVYMSYGDETLQSGGGDLLNALGYGGLLGGGAYLLLIGTCVVAAMRRARATPPSETSVFAEGVLFAMVGVLITGQLAGLFLAPEFWMVIGFCIWLGISGRPAHTALARSGAQA
jgi:hypothetical protein